MNAHLTNKRLINDFKKIENDEKSGFLTSPQEDNLLIWDAVIFGPDDSPWEGGAFNLILEFSEEYPNKPPKVKFTCPMFHPNSMWFNIKKLIISIWEWFSLFRHIN
jgi:ubiquitin-conjugating enzyme E2 A